MSADIHRLLSEQDFQTVEEMKQFLNSRVGLDFSSFTMMPDKPEDQAKELVYQARELPTEDATEFIEKALELDRTCIEAYE